MCLNLCLPQNVTSFHKQFRELEVQLNLTYCVSADTEPINLFEYERALNGMFLQNRDYRFILHSF